MLGWRTHMKVPTSYVATGEKTSPRWCKAFAAGCGGELVTDRELRPGPVAMFGSPKLWPLLEQARAEGRMWYYGDHGYFGRGRYYRVTKNALQYIRGPSWLDFERLEELGVDIAPSRKAGDHVLVCPPDEVFANLNGFDAATWRTNVLAALREITKREIRVRERTCGEGRGAPLAEDLDGAWALVTYTSNAAVEALCAGVPVICTAPSAAWDLASRRLEDVESPRVWGVRRRRDWAARLAANQWTLAEIRNGTCWQEIGEV